MKQLKSISELDVPIDIKDINNIDYSLIIAYDKHGNKIPPSVLKNHQNIKMKCEDCGTEFAVRYSTIKAFNADHHWRCKECRSKRQSELVKSSEYNIGNIVKKKLQNPELSEAYKKELSERGKRIWNSKSKEEKEIWKNKFFDGHKKHYENMTDEEKYNVAKGLRNHYENMTDEEKEALRKKQSNSKKAFLKSHPEFVQQMTENVKKYYESMSDDEKKAWADRTKKQWADMSEDERTKANEHLQKIAEAQWKTMTPEKLKARIDKTHETIANRDPKDQALINKRISDSWANLDPEEKHRRLKLSAQHSNKDKNKLHKKFESTFDSSILSDHYYFTAEYETFGNGISKFWDYGIFDENGDLQMVVDLDGAYYHGDICDYDGMHSHEMYDEDRYSSVPPGIKYHIIYEDQFKSSFKDMMKILILDYDDFVKKIFEYCRAIDFPYPHYSNKELHDAWKALVNFNTDGKYSNISINTRLGDRIITSFHPSIYHANVKGKPSPYDAWYDDRLLKKVIENRTIYVNHLNPNKILQGFNISKVAPKVSVFSAGRAKLILNKYAKEYDNIFDPFSGFGGRMLGAASLGKKYIGQDIRDRYIDENERIVQFLYIGKYVSLSIADTTQSSGTYDCLFTCPPYGDKEAWESEKGSINSCDDWINICLHNYRCKRYIFVVDETKKYKDYIADIILNKSHFGTNEEYILVIDK